MTGSTRLTLAIAGIPIAVDLPDPAWAPALRERYAAFLADDASPAWQVALAHDPTLTDTAAAWVRHEGPRTSFQVGVYAGGLDLAARAAWVSAPSAAHAASALERTLAYIAMQVLPREATGLLLHASGIVLDGRGYVFTGPSGAGKTTVARLAAGYAGVLCDENVVVREIADPGVENRLSETEKWPQPLLAGPAGPCQVQPVGFQPPGWCLLSTPFWGASTPPELIRRINRAAPLVAIFTLAHTPDFWLERLSPAEAVLALLTTEKVATERPESAAAWLAVAERLIAAVPVYRLGFRPTTELWKFLTPSLRGAS